MPGFPNAEIDSRGSANQLQQLEWNALVAIVSFAPVEYPRRGDHLKCFTNLPKADFFAWPDD